MCDLKMATSIHNVQTPCMRTDKGTNFDPKFGLSAKENRHGSVWYVSKIPNWFEIQNTIFNDAFEPSRINLYHASNARLVWKLR